MVKYVVIMGDIVESKKMDDRKVFQNKLKLLLEQVNEKYSDCIVSEFIISLGDAFQGVLKLEASTMHMIHFLSANVHPYKIRFGVGIGEVHTDIDRMYSLGMDGPAFHFAREAIVMVKQLEGMNNVAKNSVRIECEDVQGVMVYNAVLSGLYLIESNWTERQRELVLFKYFNKLNQVAIAKEFNISQAAVQKKLKNGDALMFELYSTLVDEYIHRGGKNDSL